MSLINQALRKAQRDRTPERMSTGKANAGEPANQGYQGASSGSGLSPALLIGLALIVAVLIGLVVGLSIVIFTSDSAAEATAPKGPNPSSEPLVPERVAATTPVGGGSTGPQVTPSTRSQTETATAASNIVEELRLAREAAAEATAAAEAAAAEARERAETEPSRAAIEWLGASKISGVRLAGSDSRVILNGEGFSVGDVVNFSLGLKVLVIQENRVLFEDDNGKKYMKRL